MFKWPGGALTSLYESEAQDFCRGIIFSAIVNIYFCDKQALKLFLVFILSSEAPKLIESRPIKSKIIYSHIINFIIIVKTIQLPIVLTNKLNHVLSGHKIYLHFSFGNGGRG